MLLIAKANVNHQNMDKFTPLHTACRYKFQDLANLLIKYGADLSIKDEKERTPLDLSKRYNVLLTLPENQGNEENHNQK